MFFFEIPTDAVREAAAKGSQLPGFLHDIEFWHRLGASCLASIAGLALTRVFARLQDIDRRTERVRLVSEASFILQLRQHLHSFCCDGTPWEVIERLKPQIDQFAEFNLHKVEQALKIETGEVAPARPRNPLLRIVPFYRPARPWLWIHHALYFMILGTLYFPISSDVATARRGASGLSADAFAHAIVGSWAAFLGVLLAASLFAWLASVNESSLASDSAATSSPTNDIGRVRRPFLCRFFLCFEPHGGKMWAAHILYLLNLAILARYSPSILSHAGGIVFLLVLVPWIAICTFFNLASNYHDMKRAFLAQTAGGPAQTIPRRKFWKSIRHALLFEKPQRSWLWFLNISSYFLLLLTISTTLLQILACFATDQAWLTLILTPLQILPQVIWNLTVNYINGILQFRQPVAAPVAQAA